jgi:hypothetical protein
MDFALAQLALVFMPGIIWANIDAKFGAGLRPNQPALVIRAFLFGMSTYSALYLIYAFCGKEFGYPTLGSNPERVNFFALKDEIAWSIPLSFALAIIWLWAVRFRLLMKFLHKIGASRRYGDEDVWSFTLNSDQPHVEYVHFRDLENGYIFAGWVNTYSESEDYRELLLRDVVVYDEFGEEISRPPHLYIARPKANIWMEFPYRKEGYVDVEETSDDSSDNQ